MVAGLWSHAYASLPKDLRSPCSRDRPIEAGEAKEVQRGDYKVRAHERTSMFVLAGMTTGAYSGPVKIRNMSPAGALIEGETLPQVGEKLRIVRGQLTASGEVVWRQSNKAGLQFATEIYVPAWMPAGASTKQQEVDRIVQQAKDGRTEPSPPRPPQSGPPPVTHEQLVELTEAIDALADELADDEHVIAAHGARLQALDLAAQTLRKLAARAELEERAESLRA